MKHIVMILALLASAGAWAQQPSEDDIDAVSAMLECLMEGLPENWGRAHVQVTLPEPGAITGNVRYLVAPQDALDKNDAFTPCDPAIPARIMIKLRETMSPERQGWTDAQVEFTRANRGFRITYDYPAPPPPAK